MSLKNKIIIEPNKKNFSINWKELYSYRELILILAQRDFKIRYKQTIIGGMWAIIQPFMTMIVFSFFFGKIAKIPSDGVPYPVFSYSGLLLWTFFSNCLSSSTNSMVGNAGLITKVYFPRLIIPISSTLVSVVDYLAASTIVVFLMIYFKFTPNLFIVLIPLIVLFTWLLALGLGFWLSAISVKYRDVHLIMPFFIQLLVFVTPVIYPASVSGNYRFLVSLNPMTGLIEAHRAMILGLPINFSMIGISIILTIIILITGVYYFRLVEKYFADII